MCLKQFLAWLYSLWLCKGKQGLVDCQTQKENLHQLEGYVFFFITSNIIPFGDNIYNCFPESNLKVEAFLKKKKIHSALKNKLNSLTAQDNDISIENTSTKNLKTENSSWNLFSSYKFIVYSYFCKYNYHTFSSTYTCNQNLSWITYFLWHIAFTYSFSMVA